MFLNSKNVQEIQNLFLDQKMFKAFKNCSWNFKILLGFKKKFKASKNVLGFKEVHDIQNYYTIQKNVQGIQCSCSQNCSWIQKCSMHSRSSCIKNVLGHSKIII